MRVCARVYLPVCLCVCMCWQVNQIPNVCACMLLEARVFVKGHGRHIGSVLASKSSSYQKRVRVLVVRYASAYGCVPVCDYCIAVAIKSLPPFESVSTCVCRFAGVCGACSFSILPWVIDFFSACHHQKSLPFSLFF